MKQIGYEIDGAIQNRWSQCLDGGFSIVFRTPELSIRFVELLMGCKMQEGKLLFAPSGSDELITNESSDKGRKEKISKSQRLRLVLMDRYNKISGANKVPFEQYYDMVMDSIIARVLNPDSLSPIEP